MLLKQISKTCTLALLRFFRNIPMPLRQNLLGKHIVITGAEIDSVGFYAAKMLAAWGAKVVVTHKTDAQTVANTLKQLLNQSRSYSDVLACNLDLASADSVVDFVSWYRSEVGNRLDALINADFVWLAGNTMADHRAADEPEMDIHWRINMLGTCHLTFSLLPLLRNGVVSGGEARVVNLVSDFHRYGKNRDFFDAPRYQAWLAFAKSQLGLLHFSMEFERQLSESSIVAYVVSSETIWPTAYQSVDKAGGRMSFFTRLMGGLEKHFLETAPLAAGTVVQCVSDPAMKPGYYYKRGREVEPGKSIQDTRVSAALWNSAEAWVRKANPFEDAFVVKSKLRRSVLRSGSLMEKETDT